MAYKGTLTFFMEKSETSFDKIERDVDAQEAYNRRNILKVAGVKQTKSENTNAIALDIFNAMGIPVTSYDIDRTHRNYYYSRNRRNSPPDIYVKFISHDVKDRIYANRDILRNLPGCKGIYINEVLTAVRSILFAKIRKLRGWKSWTYDGSIFMRKFEGQKPTRSRRSMTLISCI